jgi:hypothetical protein
LCHLGLEFLDCLIPMNLSLSIAVEASLWVISLSSIGAILLSVWIKTALAIQSGGSGIRKEQKVTSCFLFSSYNVALHFWLV